MEIPADPAPLITTRAVSFETPGGGNVLQIDAAKGGGHAFHGPDDLIHVLCSQTDGECIDSGKFPEQDAFTLHDRHGGFWADITEAKYRGSVCDDGY